MTHDPNILPPGLPQPVDDGAALHLLHAAVPNISLPSTQGGLVDLASSSAQPLVLFFYPRTGVPGQPPSKGFQGEEWDAIPGARGCTPQSCGFRDLAAEFASLGTQVMGVSTNTSDHQREFAARMHLPIALLSDSELALTRGMGLATFEFPVESGGPTTLLRRMAWYCQGGRIRKVWYPVFPPDQNAARVLEWLRARRSITLAPRGPEHDAFVREELTRHWGGTGIWSLGRMYEAARLPGIVAMVEGRCAGLVTYDVHPGKHQFEVVTLSAREQSRGVGELLLEAALDAGRAAGCVRAMLTTTNDNVHALGFYQRRGWRLARLYQGFVDQARRHHPSIPRVGLGGVPVRDEIELELWLRPLLEDR